MPASYAHYRFGRMLLETLPPKEQRLARHFRALYLTGLQGPDILFYHNPLVKTKVVKLGSSVHRQTGREFFTHACQQLSSDAARAYLLGLLAHYCLDSVCHPFVYAQAASGKPGHVELESEFDRHLMKLDRIPAPHTYDRGQHIGLTRGECLTVAPFYPPAKPRAVLRSARNMALFLRLLSPAKPGQRRFTARVLAIPGGQLRHHMLPEHRNAGCAHLDGELTALFDQALERYPVLLAQISEHILKKTPLGPEFDPDFG